MVADGEDHRGVTLVMGPTTPGNACMGSGADGLGPARNPGRRS